MNTMDQYSTAIDNWKDTLRTTDYHLQASTDPAYGTTLVDQHFSVGTSEYTHTFDSDYQTLYWRVRATGPYGANGGEGQGSTFHIDLGAPTSAVTGLPAVTTDTAFPVSWSGSDTRSGLRWFDVQYKDGERGEWVTWMSETTLSNALFRGDPGHSYYFRCRAMDQVGNWEDYPSGNGDTHTLVDPTAAPPTAWWNNAYNYKRNLVILNSDSYGVGAHYPVRLHFDSMTTPTAEEIYDASQTTVKGNDVRIVYQDQAELSRLVQEFSPTRIDIWFPLQAGLGGGQSDSANYQIYYGNSSAGTPPTDINEIFQPTLDEHTVALWHFQEGSGSTVLDTSGHGHNGSFSSANWTTDGRFGYAGVFNGTSSEVNFGNHTDFDLSAMTLEAWIYLTEPIGNYPHLFNKETYWLRITGGRQPHFKVFGCEAIGTCPSLDVNKWYHVAATYNGSNVCRLYVNGQMCNEKIESHAPYHTSAPFKIGWATNWPDAGHFPGRIHHARVSDIARDGFPDTRLETDPDVQAGALILPPGTGSPDLVLEDLSAYPADSALGGGWIIQAVVRNEGDAPTANGFYTDLYADHQPTGPGDLTGSVRFWIANSIDAGSTVTLTTLLNDAASSGEIFAEPLSPLEETSATLYSQADSEGVVTEGDDADNISSGVDVCIAAADPYEGDDEPAEAQPIELDEIQRHNFDGMGDQDWIEFTAQSGVTYTIRTSNLGPASDTYSYLYDSDGSTLLAANDDYGGSLASQIEWIAPASGNYYLLVKHWNPNVGGCGTTYDVSVRLAGTHLVYLPLVVRDYRPGPNRLLYVTNRSSNEVSVLNTSNNAVVATVPIGSWPQGIAIKQDGSKAYTADTVSDQVSVLDLTNNSVLTTIPASDDPVIPAISSDGSRVYVASHASNSVAVIDTSTDSVLTTIQDVQWWPWGIAASPDGAHVAVTLYGSGSVSVIDTATSSEIAEVPVGSNPQGIIYHPDGSRIYVANLGSDTVSVIDTGMYSVIQTIPVGDGPVQLSFNTSASRLYVANNSSESVSEIDVATGGVLRTFDVGAGPIDVEVIQPYLYVTNHDDDTVSVVDLESGQVTATVGGFHGPHSLAAAP